MVALALVSGLFLSAPARAASLTPIEAGLLAEKAGADLDHWDIVAAGSIADELEAGGSTSPEVEEMVALVRFHQGRYSDAVRLLDSLKGRLPRTDETLKLIRETAIQTKDFVEKKGTHFTIRYRPGPDALLADWALETLEAQRTALEHDLGFAPPENVPVEIYPDTDKFETVTTLTRKEIETTGTIALCKFNKLMITSPGALAYGYPWRDTLAHEFTHYVIARASENTVPIWLHEGLAKYEEVRWRRSSGGEPNPQTETVLAEAYQKDEWVPLKKMHPSMAKLPTAYAAALAFAEVENLIGFCVTNWKYEGIQNLLVGLKDGKPMDVALLGAFGLGLDGLWDKWKEQLSAHPPKLYPDLQVMETSLKDPKADADASGASHKGLTDEAGEHLKLGDLLAGEERPEAAIIEFKHARDAERASGGKGGHAPIFDYKIAYTYLLSNRFDEARKVLTGVLQSYPSYAPALKAMGKAELALGDPKHARENLENSVWLAPFDPEVYQLIAESCQKSGDEAGERQWDGRMKAFMKLASHEPGGDPASQQPLPHPHEKVTE